MTLLCGTHQNEPDATNIEQLIPQTSSHLHFSDTWKRGTAKSVEKGGVNKKCNNK